MGTSKHVGAQLFATVFAPPAYGAHLVTSPRPPHHSGEDFRDVPYMLVPAPLVLERPVRAEDMHEAARLFRELSVAYLANLPEEEKTEKQTQLSLSAAALDSVARSMESAGDAAQPHRGGRAIIHTSVKLIKAVLLAWRLKGGAGMLPSIVHKSISLIAADSGDIYSHLLEQAHPDRIIRRKLPSASTVTRHRLTIDLTLVHLHAQLYQKQLQEQRRSWRTGEQPPHHRAGPVPDGTARYGLIDSSPAKCGDFLWCQHAEIALADIVDVANAMFELVRLLAPPEDEGQRLDFFPPEAAEPLLEKLLRVRNHIHPPAAVTSGMRALPHKVSALVWSWSLQVADVAALESFCNSFQSMTSDSGVELGVADFRAQSLRSLFPVGPPSDPRPPPTTTSTRSC